MFSRRQIFFSAAAAVAVAPFSSALAQAVKAVAGTPHEKLNALFDAFMAENLRDSPEFATSLGVDKGEMAAERAATACADHPGVLAFKAAMAEGAMSLRNTIPDAEVA